MMALTRLPKLNLWQMKTLAQRAGSATVIYENRHNIADIITDATPALQEVVRNIDTLLPRCEEEMAWAGQHGVECISIMDSRYPARLKECEDAPLMLYCRGGGNLNARRIVSMVGTRKITDYGRQLCEQFIRDLSALCPEVMIVSGLAYGVDVCCHRQALANDVPTVGVLAHGLDRIYPAMHRDTAEAMTRNGALLTEFMSRTSMEKRFFVQRNRIVAGCADATIVVESAAKGGSLLTADTAHGYGRPVFAFPGRIDDTCSAGCNRLIADNKAEILLGAEDFVAAMGWQSDKARSKQLADGIQQELFPRLTGEEQLVADALSQHESMQLNHISEATGIGVSRLSGLLFTMEMNGTVRMTSGGVYRLNRM